MAGLCSNTGMCLPNADTSNAESHSLLIAPPAANKQRAVKPTNLVLHGGGCFGVTADINCHRTRDSSRALKKTFLTAQAHNHCNVRTVSTLTISQWPSIFCSVTF